MPHESGTEGDGARKDERQEQAASDLADRAAESVDRRYDATKELHLDDVERDGDGDGE